MSLIIPNQPLFNINSLYREDLGILKNALWKNKIKSCKKLLRVRREKSATRLRRALRLPVYKKDSKIGARTCHLSYKNRSRRPRSNHGNIINTIIFFTHFSLQKHKCSPIQFSCCFSFGLVTFLAFLSFFLLTTFTCKFFRALSVLVSLGKRIRSNAIAMATVTTFSGVKGNHKKAKYPLDTAIIHSI